MEKVESVFQKVKLKLFDKSNLLIPVIIVIFYLADRGYRTATFLERMIIAFPVAVLLFSMYKILAAVYVVYIKGNSNKNN